MKYVGMALAIGGVVLGTLAAYVYFCSPRMWVMPHLLAFQAPEPMLPAGVVPVEAAPPLPTAEEAAGVKSPVPASPETLEAGAVYYQYYCIFCHGPNGDGNGPVGESYVPKPADLRDTKYAAYSDGQLLRGILLGVGHEPVLERVVRPEHRWSLVQYTRQFSKP